MKHLQTYEKCGCLFVYTYTIHNLLHVVKHKEEIDRYEIKRS